MNQGEKIAYYPHILGQTDKIMNQYIESKKGMEEYLSIMLERANIEESYAKALYKLQLQIDKSNVIIMKEQLMSQLKNKIIRIENFVELIRTEIKSQIRETLNQQSQTSNKIMNEIKLLEETLTEKKDQLLSTYMDYKLKSKDYEQSAIVDIVYQHSFDVSEDQIIKQICKTQYIQIECSKQKKQYQQLTIAYNEFLDVYKTKMESYLIQMEEFEQTKLLIHKDTLLKIFLVEFQMYKQQYQEIEKFNEIIQNTNIQDVIENFIIQYCRPDYQPKQFEFQNYCSFLSQEIEFLKSQEYHKLQDLIKAYTDTFYTIFNQIVEKNENQQSIEEQELQNLINGDSIQGIFKCFLIHINSIWNDGQFNNDKTIIELLKQNILNKLLWLIALDMQANKNDYKVPNSKAYELIIKWSQILIDSCIEQQDITPLRKLITLSSLIYISIQNKKHFLMHNIKNNKFTQSDFIEANIIEATYDGMTEEVKQEQNNYEKIVRQKINCFTQISKIFFTLLIFNQNNIIKNYSDKYLKLLNMAQNAVQDLTFQIESYQQL